VAEKVTWVHSHRATLAEARNATLEHVETEWVVFLDADDELEPGYVAALGRGTADVRGPIVRYMLDGQERNLWQPRVFGHEHDCTAACLEAGNWLVIGSAVRADLLRAVGGFRDFNWSEDWDLWLRCRAAGATFELIPDAVYRAHVRPDSRNRAPDRAAKVAAHREIAAANGIAA
jgi:cellulose synthase/poly-beta-1,6-N-acetylglucosamine synthase-like glycosyltransferase